MNHLPKSEPPRFGQRKVIFYKALFQAVLQVILFEFQNEHLKQNRLKSEIENKKRMNLNPLCLI